MLTKEQLALRKKGIGGSDVAAILGMSDYKDAIDIFKDKTSTDIKEKEESEKMHWGNVLESPIALEYSEQTGNKVYSVSDTYFHTAGRQPTAADLLYKHPLFDWAIANIDRIYEQPDGTRGILEIKTTSKNYMSGWKYDIPREWYCQVQHYLWIGLAIGVVKSPIAHIAILASGQEFSIVPVELDDVYLKNAIPELDRFWKENVLAGVAPEPTTGDQVEKLYTSLTDKQIEASDEVAELVKNLAETQLKSKIMEREIENYKDKIKLIMLDAEILVYKGDLLATWKKVTQSKLSEKELTADYPDIVREYKRESSYRKFLCKLGVKEE